jgi:UDP-4-amino-4-deoxy-L-arabinose formyltransferase/UDP-glucuronic acid dehydrogenase (UDP-4-keto-hexauronic acid decarboxylating)
MSPGTPLRVLLVGAEGAAVQVLEGLAGMDHEIVAVAAEVARGTGAALGRRADAMGLPVLEARDRVTDPAFADWIREREVDVLLNVHSLSIVHDEVTRAPRIGSFNLHPGPLPAYAGMNVVTWAIARGETSHGVTLHWMDARVDTGAVAYAATFPVGPDDTALTVFTRCIREGVGLVFRLLDDAARDPAAIPRVPQVGERTLYLRRQVPEDGRVRWDRPARAVHDLVRACDFGPFPSPCGHPVTRAAAGTVGVLGSVRTGVSSDVPPGTVGEPGDGVAMVATADEWLGIRGVVVDGGRRAATEVLRPGERLVEP